MALFPRQIGVLQRGLEAASLRQAVLAHNLANVNTPGYRAQAVRFEDALQQALDQAERPPGPGLAMKVTHERHFQVPPVPVPDPAQVQAAVVRDATRAARADGNNVDVDAEMARVAANQIWYSALSRQISDEFLRLRLAITEGRR